MNYMYFTTNEGMPRQLEQFLYHVIGYRYQKPFTIKFHLFTSTKAYVSKQVTCVTGYWSNTATT